MNKINIKNKLSKYEIFSILISALVNDINHHGYTKYILN